jgi:hypothetical protein
MTVVTLAHGRGVNRDLAVHRLVLTDVLAFAQEVGFAVRGLVRVRFWGGRGTLSFLFGCPEQESIGDLANLVNSVL